MNDDGDDDYGYDYCKTMMTDDASSAMVAPVACSFHYIPPQNSEKQSSRLNASYCSPVCDESYNCMSSEGEFSSSLPDFRISDHDSCRSSCSFGGILYKLLFSLQIVYLFNVAVNMSLTLIALFD